MKYLLIIIFGLFVSCSGNFNSQETKDAETLAILLDMSITDIFADINKAIEVWKSMPEEIRSTKNPVKNPYDFNIETDKCIKHLIEINRDIEKRTSGNVPSELGNIITGFYNIYSSACKEISDSNTSYSKIVLFIDKTEPEYKKFQIQLTKVQEKIRGR